MRSNIEIKEIMMFYVKHPWVPKLLLTKNERYDLTKSSFLQKDVFKSGFSS